MILINKINQVGDTIIEVMLSMALLTMFLFISWGITNKATQIGINSRKRVDVINSMKEQAEIIKAQYAKSGTAETIFAAVSPNPTVAPTSQLLLSSNPCESNPVNLFHFTEGANDSLVRVPSPKLIPDAENKVWIQYIAGSESGVVTHYDFYIRACWQTIGSVQDTDSSQFIVRLNK